MKKCDKIKRAFVTGGGGFLGGAIIKALRKNGINILSFSRSFYDSVAEAGAEQIQGDLQDYNAVVNAMKSCDCVFHVAAKPGIWGDYRDYYSANVTGTLNIIAACRKLKISRLVYTSSPSVIFNGSDMENVDETTPYPEKYDSFYPRTKATAERYVMAAAGKSLATVSLRPHIIWGPGDRHLIPRLIHRSRAGALRIVGNGNNLIDTIFVDNAADAHIQAMEKLSINSKISGKSYFLSQDEPVNAWDFMNRILKIYNLPPVKKRVSFKLARTAGTMMEFMWTLLARKDEPRMTRFLAEELATSHWFDISAAKKDLGYSPEISIDQGLELLKESSDICL